MQRDGDNGEGCHGDSDGNSSEESGEGSRGDSAICPLDEPDMREDSE
ncbi:MAG: hypothetical protein ACM3XR_04315 [Bacillota bacterium]